MAEARHSTGWQRYLVRRQESLKTTWTLRLLVLVLVGVIGYGTRPFWLLWIGQSLVCQEEKTVSDAILVENFDPDYLLFAQAKALQQAGLAARVLVPVPTSDDPTRPNAVSQGITEVIARVAGLPAIESIPIQLQEPISLNAALQIRDFLRAAQVHSVLVVAPGFRSRRSSLVYRAVLEPAQIGVRCIPVFREKTLIQWAASWHGIQNITEQWIKLQYYQFYVLPRYTIGGGARW